MAPVVHIPLVAPDGGCIISLYENVLDPQEAAEYLETLSESLPFATETDNWGPQSRPTCYFGDEDCIFSYVGLRLEPKSWPESLLALRKKVAEACCDNNNSMPAAGRDDDDADRQQSRTVVESLLLTACLVNLYNSKSPSNHHHIPWHYDEVRAHGDRKIVASLSLGGPRRFLIRKRGGEEDRRILVDRMLPSGSVVWMEGSTQEKYEHCLPKQEGDDGGELRISLTFRSIVPGYETNREIAEDVCCT
jgi:alkylated DNA repair dioxygenase AlkB